jgi:voltage-gated potassium channel
VASRPVTPFADLDRRTRRTLLRRVATRTAGTSLVLFALYFVLPLQGERGAGAVVLLAGGLVVFAAVLGWQVREIVVADYPHLRAVEAVGVAIPLVVVVFSAVYLSMAQADPSAFSEELSRIDALYFTVTTLGTVGFGDITATAQATRLVVTIQMMVDLVLIGFIIRLLFGAAEKGLQRRAPAPADETPGS